MEGHIKSWHEWMSDREKTDHENVEGTDLEMAQNENRAMSFYRKYFKKANSAKAVKVK